MEGLERTLKEHPFFARMPNAFCELVCGCAKDVRFEAGQYLFHEGEPADWFYLLRHGRVALQLTVPGRGAVTFRTIAEGEIVGVSWLIPPYRWTYDAKAIVLTRAIAMDANCLRQKCEADHDLGYEMMKRFMPVLIQSSQATRFADSRYLRYACLRRIATISAADPIVPCVATDRRSGRSKSSCERRSRLSQRSRSG